MLRQFFRWLYRGHRPNALARWINRGTAAVFARGVAPDYFVMLEVVGRRSGRPISFPLVMAVVDGHRYLVSMLGVDVAWVQNVKATAGRAVLRHGRTEQVRLEELPIEKRAPVLKALCLLLIRPIDSRRPPDVFVMEPTDAWHLHHPALARRLNTPR